MTPSAVLATTSVAIAFATVIGLFLQIRHSTKIARRSSNLNFISELESSQIEAELDERLIEIGVGSVAVRRGVPFEDAEVEQILRDPKATGAMNMLLNHLENIAIARDFKLVDPRIWHRVHGGRLLWWATMLQRYILRARTEYGDPEMWRGVSSRAEAG